MPVAHTSYVAVVDPGYGSYDTEQAILGPLGVVVRDCTDWHAKSDLKDKVAGAVGFLVRESRIDADVIAAASLCRGIVRYGVGVDNIDLTAAARAGIKVANVPDYGVDDVSDHALALLLSVGRRIVTRDNSVRDGAWNVARNEPMYRFAGRTLGLLGYGRIGARFHRKAAALGFARTIVFDPAATLPADVEAVDLLTLMMESDVLSCHAPLNDQTRHIVNGEALARMKPTAIIVNTARGGLIDEAALVEALWQRKIFGAGLDVFEVEPLPSSSPLRQLPNVVLTDHTAWYSEDSVAELQTKAATEMARILRGEDPIHWVNSKDFAGSQAPGRKSYRSEVE